ncbi:MAG: OmpH family outer membrane protein [Phascolarctobacterium sp.]|nr:OmpH family outer membrane protein [Phascolarctobacterium sp.]
MKKNILAFILVIAVAFGVCGIASAADVGDLIGVVNMQQLLSSYPDYASAMSAVELEEQKAQQEFESKSGSLDDNGKKALYEKLLERIAKRQKDLLEPLNKKIRKAIETVAKRNGIANVVNSNAMLFGGKDLTQEVLAEVSK